MVSSFRSVEAATTLDVISYYCINLNGVVKIKILAVYRLLMKNFILIILTCVIRM